MPSGSYHVICSTGITCYHTYMYSHAWQKTIPATKIRQAQWRTTSGVWNISELEGIPPKFAKLRTCVRYPLPQCYKYMHGIYLCALCESLQDRIIKCAQILTAQN